MKTSLSTSGQKARTPQVSLNLVMILALLIVSAAFPTRVRADSTIMVNTIADTAIAGDGFCTLREAITNANGENEYTSGDCVTGSGVDTIKFDISLGTATITLASALPLINDVNGLIIDGEDRITVSGNDSVPVFNANSGPLTLQYINVTHGYNSSTGGGGLYNGGGTVIITHSTFSSNNATASGGGVLNELGTITITHSAFSNNSSGNGGGVANMGTMTITDSAFLNNNATADGGGVINGTSGALTITNSTFSNNSANYGGGLMNNSGNATIINSTFSGNTATGNGGAIGTYKGATPVPETTIYNSILANSAAFEDCWNQGAGFAVLIGGNNIIETTSNCSSIATLTSDPDLGALTGSPAYFPLNSGSPAIDDTVGELSSVGEGGQFEAVFSGSVERWHSPSSKNGLSVVTNARNY